MTAVSPWGNDDFALVSIPLSTSPAKPKKKTRVMACADDDSRYLFFNEYDVGDDFLLVHHLERVKAKRQNQVEVVRAMEHSSPLTKEVK